MAIPFGTKAETLLRLRDVLTSATILPLDIFSCAEWRADRKTVLSMIRQKLGPERLTVRSSAQSEDSSSHTQAGKFLSLSNVDPDHVESAIDQVIASYGPEDQADNQILVQPTLQHVTISGVLFTRDPASGAPYYIINFDTSGSTASVTSGTTSHLQTKVVAHSGLSHVEKGSWVAKLIAVADELRRLLHHDSLDIEFALDIEQKMFLFQVRRLTLRRDPPIDLAEHRQELSRIECKIKQLNVKHPYLHGHRTIFGIMPDWNPAEVIGIRPRPLALSLYKELFTDTIWAYQRDNYGYRNLRSFPLMVDFMGLPYIDARVSFNSFLPKDLDEGLANRLVNYYLDRLSQNRSLHDKVEFRIVYSCDTFDLEERTHILKKYGFSKTDIRLLTDSLRKLTKGVAHHVDGLWRNDARKIEILRTRQTRIFENADFDEVSRIYWLIEDCKRYGTLPFAGLARAGFIAMEILNSMVSVGALDGPQRTRFLNSLDTVTSQISQDFARLDREAFLKKYGHLRPGTYNILSPRYDEAADLYFDWQHRVDPPARATKRSFRLTRTETADISKRLKQHPFSRNVTDLFTFLKGAIEGREHAKFIFTRSLSDVLSTLKALGQRFQIDAEDLSFIDIQSFLRLYGSSWDIKAAMHHSIAEGRRRYDLTSQVMLPALMSSPQDVWSFDFPEDMPNYVTHGSVTAPVNTDLQETDAMRGAIVFIPSADPGFDWIFTRGVVGFVTMYGGVNSHMAIRANELGLPAVIGAGQKMYQYWSRAKVLHMDCENRRVEVLR